MTSDSPPDRKNVLVAGASSRIGEATARRFAAEGWNVCLTARRGELLERITSELPAGNHLYYGGDSSRVEDVEKIGELVRGSWGRLDVLIDSVGISEEADAIDAPLEVWRRCLDVMIDSAVHLTRMSVPLMTDGGRIVYVTSTTGRFAWRNISAYSMAKAAIDQYCRNLALELADRGILVNVIAPGFIDTPMSRATGVNELETEWFRVNYVDGQHLPLRRAGQPEEIAGVALFLAGPDATYINGHVLTVDGGLTICK